MQTVVITFDHLALSQLGCYGNTWISTPRFDRLAAASIVFDQCYSGAPVSCAAGLCTVAETLQRIAGVTTVIETAADTPVSAELQTAIGNWTDRAASDVPALLWIQCRAITSPWRAPPAGSGEYWQRFFTVETLRDTIASALPALTSPEETSRLEPVERPEDLVAAALPQLTASGLLSREAFPSAAGAAALRRMVYAAAVSSLDAWLGEVLDLLEPQPQDPGRWLIVAAATGDVPGIHPSLVEGCPPLVEPLVHVPLLIRTGSAADGTRRSALVSMADLAPTLAEAFQLDLQARLPEGVSLGPLVRDEAESVRDAVFCGSGSIGWTLRTPEFACVCGPEALRQVAVEPDSTAARTWLFVKPYDICDVLDVAPQHPDATDRMLRRIRETVARQTGADRG